MLGVTLSKEVKDIYDKDFKFLKKETEEDTRRWEALPCSWISRINVVKWRSYQKESTVSMQSPLKFQHNPLLTLKEQYSAS